MPKKEPTVKLKLNPDMTAEITEGADTFLGRILTENPDKVKINVHGSKPIVFKAAKKPKKAK